MKTRKFRVKRNDSTNMWTINDDSWQDVIASGYKKVVADPARDSVEVWEIENSSGGWFHPLHIHLVDFQILSRNGNAPFALRAGPERCRVRGGRRNRPAPDEVHPPRGLYMMHCHNLPHEDHDMMPQFRVGKTETDVDPNDPMTAAKAAWDEEKD